MAEQQYAYQALPERSIRLLTIVEESADQLGLCLKTYSLAEHIEFNALSYVWGTESAPHRINILNEDRSIAGSIGIQWNLFNALPYIKVASAKPIWIDAVCINQADNDEKARVVPMMGDYYGNAAEILIWLGVTNERSDLVMDLLAWLWDPSQREVLQHRLCIVNEWLAPSHLYAIHNAIIQDERVHDTAKDMERLGLPALNHPMWTALTALYRRDWFFRVWTFQEIMLAKQARVLCGNRSLPWKTFQTLGNRLSETQLLWISEGNGRHTFTPMRDLKHAYNGGEWFWMYLRGAQDRHCRYNEDRVYGLLALAPHSIRVQITVSYRPENPNHWIDVFRSMTVVCLHELATEWKERPLQIVLVAATNTNRVHRRNINLPSWCPDWSTSAISNATPAVFSADPAHLAREMWSVDHVDVNMIHVDGVEVDEVHEVIDDYVYSWPEGVSGIDGPADKMLQWLDRCLSVAQRTLSSVHAGNEAVWKTLVAHSDTRNQHDYPADPIRGLVAHKKRLAECRDSVSRPDTSLSPADLAALGPYIAYAGTLWPGKVFFSTVKGTVGLAEKGIKSGDAICMLFGACKYFVLHSEEAGRHSLVASAYVHGMMEDTVEALRQRDGTVLSNVCAQTFKLC
nr:hypothetical protein B0A51_17789 [Rachicladosporium sp. CCFEE 5018]